MMTRKWGDNTSFPQYGILKFHIFDPTTDPSIN
jgi:hypothetical protein